MKELNASARTDISATEVEFTAEDLAELSPPTAIRLKPIAPRAAKKPAVSARNLFLPFAVAAAVAAAIGAQYWYSTQQSSTASAAPQAAVHLAKAEFVPDTLPPTRFANPFDPTEVFEFPSGTSDADMHAAVADFLIERAMLREQHLQAQR